MTDLGLAAYGRGDRQTARSYFDASHVAAGQGQTAELFDVALVHGFLAILDCEEGRYLQAAEHLAEALPIWQRLNNQENLAEWLSGGCRTRHCAARTMNPAPASWGGPSRFGMLVGHAFTLPERVAYDRAEQSLRTVLGAEAYEAAAESGAAMPVQQALADAAAYLDKVRSAASKPDCPTNRPDSA